MTPIPAAATLSDLTTTRFAVVARQYWEPHQMALWSSQPGIWHWTLREDDIKPFIMAREAGRIISGHRRMPGGEVHLLAKLSTWPTSRHPLAGCACA